MRERLQAQALQVQSAPANELIYACEHEPVYTTGRRGIDNRTGASLPAPLLRTDRGGETTFHGPGQIMLYPVVDLRARGLGVRDYVYALEQSCIDLLAGMGIQASRRCGLPGVWTERGKIAAIGIRVQHGVAWHGMALNVQVDPAWFAAINPCGTGLGIDRLGDHPQSEVYELEVIADRWARCCISNLPERVRERNISPA